MKRIFQSLVLLLSVCSFFQAQADTSGYAAWKLETPGSVQVYGNYTQEKISYAVGVDAELFNSHELSDTVTVDCAGSVVRVAAGKAIACHLPANAELRWYISADDFKHGAQGKKGKLV